MEKELSEATKSALAVLEKASEPMSLEEISDAAGITVRSGNLTALIKKGTIVSEERTRVCPTCGHKSVYHVFSIAK